MMMKMKKTQWVMNFILEQDVLQLIFPIGCITYQDLRPHPMGLFTHIIIILLIING